MADNKFKQILSPLDSLTQQANRLQAQTTEIFNGLTSELVGVGNSLMNAASAAASTVTGFISGADAAFSNFITRISPNELLTKRSGLESLLPAGSIISASKMNLLGTNSLQFPLNPSDAKYKIRLSFREYVRPSALSPPQIIKKNSIVLPIPAELNESHNIGWETEQSTGLMGAIVNAFGGDDFEGKTKGIKDAMNSGDIGDVLSQVSNAWGSLNDKTANPNNAEYGDVKRGAFHLAKRYAMKKAAPELFDLGTQILGEIPNPHPTVLFRGVGLREYRFSFRFAPTSKKESEMLRKIINKLREYSLPKYVSNTDKNMFKYPMMVYPEFIASGGQSVGKNGGPGELAKVYPFGFKYCVVSNIDINYAPTGNPAFFANGKGETAFIVMNIALKEIEVQTSEDFGDGATSGGSAFQQATDLLNSVSSGSILGGSSLGGIISSNLPPPNPITNSSNPEQARALVEGAFNAPT